MRQLLYMSVSQIQFILLGASRCGKTSLVSRWTDPSKMPLAKETVGIDVFSCATNDSGVVYSTKFWDTAGRECYSSLLKSYIFNADCAIVVYDVSSPTSWTSVDRWLTMVEETNGARFPVVLVGNQIDKHSSRVVYKQEVMGYINSHSMSRIVYCECSAMTGDGTMDAYHLAVNYAKKGSSETVYTAKSFRKESGCLIV